MEDIRKTRVSVIISAFNEEGNIKECIQRIIRTMPNAEVVLVHGGKDRTAEIAREMKRKDKKYRNIKIVINKNDRGKGHATRVGIKNSKYDLMAQVDADCQFPPEELPILIKPILDKKTEIVFASRYCKGASYERNSVTRFARLATWVDSFLTNMLSGYRLTDVNAGFKAWTRKAINAVDMKCDHFGYEPEIAVMASKRGYKIVEVPIHYKGREQGKSRVSLIMDGIKIMTYLFKVKFFRK